MRRLSLLLVLSACGGGMPSDDFDYGDEFWSLDTTSEDPTFSLERSTFDNGDGPHICGEDHGFAGALFWRFLSPSKYAGNYETAYGKRITWEQMTIVPGQPNAPLLAATDLKLKGRGTTLVINVPNIPRIAKQWVTFGVVLDPDAANWVKESDGARASEADMRTVLATLQSISLPGEWRDGPETTCIDNVYFGTR